MRGREEQSLERQDERDKHEVTLGALLSAHLIAPDAPVDSQLIDDALGRRPARLRGIHRAGGSIGVRVGKATAAAAVAAAGACAVTVGAYAGVLPQPMQRVAHDLINAPYTNPGGHHSTPPGSVVTTPGSQLPGTQGGVTTSAPGLTRSGTPHTSPSPTPTPTPTPSPTPSTPGSTDVQLAPPVTSTSSDQPSTAPTTAPVSTPTTHHGKPSSPPGKPSDPGPRTP